MGSQSSKNKSRSISSSGGGSGSKMLNKLAIRSKSLKDEDSRHENSIRRTFKSLRISKDHRRVSLDDKSSKSKSKSKNKSRNGTIAKRKITDADDSTEHIANNTNNTSINISTPMNESVVIPKIKLNAPPYELPEIESVKSMRRRSNSSGEGSHKINVEPRRSLQNSLAGIKKIGSGHMHKSHHLHKHTHSTTSSLGHGHGHGFFNIPVTIDNNNKSRSTDTDDFIDNDDNSFLPSPTDRQVTRQNTDNNMISTPERKISDNLNNSTFNDTNNSTSILGTILSMAHTAISHVPKPPQTIYNDASKESVTFQDDLVKPDNSNMMLQNSNSNTSTTNSTSQLPNDTVVHNQMTSTPSEINMTASTNNLVTDVKKDGKDEEKANNDNPHRSTSFLRHLDSLLSPGSQILGSQTSSSSLLSKDGDIEGGNDDDTKPANEPSERNSLNKVKFESINSINSGITPEPPTISTLGHGDLTLDIFEDTPSSHPSIISDSNVLSKKNIPLSDKDELSNNNNNNTKITTNDALSDTVLEKTREREHSLLARNGGMATTNPSTTPVPSASAANIVPHKNMTAANRNSSYIDVSKHNLLPPQSRERSKTLPAKDMPVVENNKRNSRYSSLSNDEYLTVNTNNNTTSERKSRSMSRNFLGRRSFSPNLTKVMGIRPSMNRNRNSTDVTESRGGSTSFDDMMNPVVNIDYNKPSELKGVEYSTEKKNAEFHNLFKDSGLLPEEKLIIDHSCALSRDILLQGRIYISDQHLCFYSNILGWVSTVIIPFKEIVQIEKKTTAGIFPNGIVIDTLHSKYIFASFISRDATFDLITDVWNQIILGRRYVKDIGSGDDFSDMHSDYSLGDSGDSSFDDMDIDYMDEEDDEDEDDGDNDDDEGNDTDMTSSDELENESIVELGKRSKANTVTTLVNAFPGPATHDVTKCDYKPVANERLISEVNIDAPVGQVAQILYGDNTTRLASILKAQQNFDLSPIPPLLKTKTRDYFYYKPLHFGFGPNKTKCLIVDKVLHYDLDDYVQVIQESKTPDVPSGNSFTIRTNTILTWDSNNTTKVTTYFLAEWSSKSWLKGAIEKGAFDGVIDTTKTQLNEVTKFIKEDKTKSPTRKSISQSKKASNKTTTGDVDEDEDIEDSKSNNLPSLGPATHAPTEPEYLKSKDDVIITKDLTFNVPLGTVFQLLCGDDSSYLKQIVEKQNTFDISTIPKFVNNEREYTYIKKLNNPLGPKQTKCTIKEKIEHMDINNYILVKQSVTSHDVPYGSAFTVQTRTFYSWGPNNTTKLLVVMNVVWTGKCFIKGTVEKASQEGQKESIAVIKDQVNSIISNLSKKKTKKRSKTIRSRSTTTVDKPEQIEESKETVPATNEASGGMFSPIFSVWEDFDLFSIKGIITLLVTIFAFIWIVRSLFLPSDAKHDFKLVSHDRILIDGNEFTYVPNFKTLYQVYEDEIRQNVKQSKKIQTYNDNHIDIIGSSQKSISSWLQDRGYGNKANENLAALGDVEEDLKDNNDNNDTQNNKKQNDEVRKLMESIKITELQLNEMKDTLAKLQT